MPANIVEQLTSAVILIAGLLGGLHLFENGWLF